MSEREEEVEKAIREMGDISWQHFAGEAARPTTLWRLLTLRTWKGRQVPMSEWFDSESKAQERLAHHAANDEVETTGFDRYVLCSELAALRQQLAEKEKQLAEARAEVERLNRQSTPYRNRDSGYIRLVPHGEDVTAWLDSGRWEKVDGWGELGPLQNLQTSISILGR